MQVKTGSQLEPKTYYLGGISSLVEVRNDITVSSIAQIISNHILSCNIRPAVDSWQSARWQNFIDKKAYDVIGEMILNGLVWGESIADVVVGVDKSLRYVITDIIPLDMGLVVKRRQNEPKSDCDITAYMVRYGGAILDTSRLSNLVLYTEGGAPSPLGLKVAGAVRRMNESLEIEHFAVGSSVLGSYYGVSDPNSASDPEALTKFFSELGNSMMVKQILNGWEIKQVPTAANKKEITDAFGAVFARNRNLVLTQYLMQWMVNTETNTGTYGSMQAWLDAYGRFVSSMANAVCGYLDSLSIMESKWSGLPPVTFTCDPIAIGQEKEDPKQRILTLMQSPLVSKGAFDKGVITDAESREALGLPPQEVIVKEANTFTTAEILQLQASGIITTDEARVKLGLQSIQPVQPVQTDTNQATRENAVNTWLSKSKKEAVRKEVQKAVDRKMAGQGTQFKFTQVDRLVQSTSLNRETADALVMNLETNVKSLISDIATGAKTILDFDALWTDFESGVRNAIQ